MTRTLAVAVALLATLGPCPLVTSCASDESNTKLRRRLDDRNEDYRERQERRRIRQEAREERYDIWWDRIMGR